MPDGVKIRPSNASDAVDVHSDAVTYDGLTGVVQRVKLGVGAPGSYDDIDASHPLPTSEAGTYGYATGTTTTTVDVPSGALLKRVSVIAGASAAATVGIGGGPVITVPAGGGFDELIPGRALGADVIIGGTIQSYYVSWVV